MFKVLLKDLPYFVVLNGVLSLRSVLTFVTVLLLAGLPNMGYGQSASVLHKNFAERYRYTDSRSLDLFRMLKRVLQQSGLVSQEVGFNTNLNTLFHGIFITVTLIILNSKSEMDLKELEIIINNLKLPHYYFQINEKRLNWPALYIHPTEDKWTVFYAERGIKEGIKLFDTEHDACVYFLSIAKDMEEEDPIFGSNK